MSTLNFQNYVFIFIWHSEPCNYYWFSQIYRTKTNVRNTRAMTRKTDFSQNWSLFFFLAFQRNVIPKKLVHKKGIGSNSFTYPIYWIAKILVTLSAWDVEYIGRAVVEKINIRIHFHVLWDETMCILVNKTFQTMRTLSVESASHSLSSSVFFLAHSTALRYLSGAGCFRPFGNNYKLTVKRER